MTKQLMNQQQYELAIINAKAPYGSSAGKDALDIALIFSSYEQSISLFFQGDGVYQLVAGHDGSIIHIKDYLKTFAAFEFYEIERVFVCQQSLVERNLEGNFHIEGVSRLNCQQFANKLQQHKTILRY